MGFKTRPRNPKLDIFQDLSGLGSELASIIATMLAEQANFLIFEGCVITDIRIHGDGDKLCGDIHFTGHPDMKMARLIFDVHDLP